MAMAAWSTSRSLCCSRPSLLAKVSIRCCSNETDLGALGSEAPPVGWGHVLALVPAKSEGEESLLGFNLKVTRWLLALARTAASSDARCPRERCSKRFFNACGSRRRKKGQNLPTRQQSD